MPVETAAFEHVAIALKRSSNPRPPETTARHLSPPQPYFEHGPSQSAAGQLLRADARTASIVKREVYSACRYSSGSSFNQLSTLGAGAGDGSAGTMLLDRFPLGVRHSSAPRGHRSVAVTRPLCVRIARTVPASAPAAAGHRCQYAPRRNCAPSSPRRSCSLFMFVVPAARAHRHSRTSRVNAGPKHSDTRWEPGTRRFSCLYRNLHSTMERDGKGSKPSGVDNRPKLEACNHASPTARLIVPEFTDDFGTATGKPRIVRWRKPYRQLITWEQLRTFPGTLAIRK